MQIKFELYNLFFDGGKVPPSPTALKDTICDLVETVKAQGAEVHTIPTKPVSFSTLVGDLESLGLLSSTETDPPPTQVEPDDPLVLALKAQVGSLFISVKQNFTKILFRSSNT